MRSIARRNPTPPPSSRAKPLRSHCNQALCDVGRSAVGGFADSRLAEVPVVHANDLYTARPDRRQRSAPALPGSSFAREAAYDFPRVGVDHTHGNTHHRAAGVREERGQPPPQPQRSSGGSRHDPGDVLVVIAQERDRSRDQIARACNAVVVTAIELLFALHRFELPAFVDAKALAFDEPLADEISQARADDFDQLSGKLRVRIDVWTGIPGTTGAVRAVRRGSAELVWGNGHPGPRTERVLCACL